MSLLGTWFAKFGAAIGGWPAAGVIVTGGLVAGIIVGGVTGGGGLGPSPSPSVVLSEVYPCPNMGPPLLTIESGQHVFVTGKSADGAWLRIHGGMGEAWVPAAAYTPAQADSLDTVPIAECAPEALFAIAPSPDESDTPTGSNEPTAIPTATPAPTASPTPSPTPTPTPTPKPGATPRPTPRATPRVTPPPTPPPTPVPTPSDKTPPIWSSLTAQWKSGFDCQTILVSAVVTDQESDVTSVTLLWFDGNQGQGSKKMTKQSGRLWTAEIGTPLAPPVPGNWLFYATAKSAGGESESPVAPFTVHC